MYNVLIKGLNGDEYFKIIFPHIQSFTELISLVVEYIKENNDDDSDYKLLYNEQIVYEDNQISDFDSDIKLDNNIILYFIKINNNIDDLIENLMNSVKKILNKIKEDLRFFSKSVGILDKVRQVPYTWAWVLNHHNGTLYFKDIVFSNKLVIYNKLYSQENGIFLDINELKIITITEDGDGNYNIGFPSIEDINYSQNLSLECVDGSSYFNDFYQFLYLNIDNDDIILDKFKKMFKYIFKNIDLIYMD